MSLTVDTRSLSWLVTSFCRKVPGVANALVVSSDGLPLAMSEHLGAAGADQLSAIASGIASLTAGAARCLDAGAVRQSIVEMEHGFLFVMTISDGSVLAVLTSSEADLGLVAYEMALLVTRVGVALTPSLRTAAPLAPAPFAPAPFSPEPLGAPPFSAPPFSAAAISPAPFSPEPSSA